MQGDYIMGKSLSDILSAGNSAEKFREHLGETLTIRDVLDVNTSNGPAVQMLVTKDGNDEEFLIWAPSVVARQVTELAENGFLPTKLTLSEMTSQNGREYFTLTEPDSNAMTDDLEDSDAIG
jgi:hypothetical protein